MVSPEPDHDGRQATRDDNGTDYGQPFGWWGSRWTPGDEHSILWLIERGALDVPTAAFLSLAVEARASLLVVAEPHAAGKTTLLTALLDFLPEGCVPIYLRGWYERFTFLDTCPPERCYMLCNEISAHLPTYLWGRGVRRVFDAVAVGYPLATTMHACSAADALEQLSSYPLEVPMDRAAKLDLVVTIGVGYAGNRLLRRVASIERIAHDPDGAPRIVEIARRAPLRGDITYQTGRYIAVLAEISAASDLDASARLARRVRQIEEWLARGLASAPSIRGEVVAARR